METQTRCQADTVTLTYLCLCLRLARDSSLREGKKSPLNLALGPAGAQGGRTDPSPTGNSFTRLGALGWEKSCLPHVTSGSLSAGLRLAYFLLIPNIWLNHQQTSSQNAEAQKCAKRDPYHLAGQQVAWSTCHPIPPLTPIDLGRVTSPSGDQLAPVFRALTWESPTSKETPQSPEEWDSCPLHLNSLCLGFLIRE